MRLRHVVATVVAGGFVVGIAFTAQGRANVEPSRHVYAVTKSPLVVGARRLAPVFPNKLHVAAQPDATDPWTGEPVAIPARTIGLLTADNSDPWTGEKLDVAPPRAPMQDDQPFGAAAHDGAKTAFVIARPKIDSSSPF